MIPAHIEHTFRALDRIERRDSPASTDTANKPYMTSHGQEDTPHAGLGSVEAGTLYPVTCGERYYNAANQILEDESHIWTRENCNELGALIEQWISDARDNREPR
jgi:hypothetical protein